MARGGGAGAVVRLDPGTSFVDKGAMWRSARRFPCAKMEGEMGVRSMTLGGGRREGGEPGGVGATRGGGSVAGKMRDR
jgi:hypothetical protein